MDQPAGIPQRMSALRFVLVNLMMSNSKAKPPKSWEIQKACSKVRLPSRGGCSSIADQTLEISIKAPAPIAGRALTQE